MKEWVKKKKYILLLWIGIPFLCVAAVYIRGVCYYQDHFVQGTVINQADVSGMSVQQLTERIRDYALRVEERRSDGTVLEEVIRGEEIGLAYSSTQPFEEILRNQNVYLWFLKQDTVQETEKLITYQEEELEARMDALAGFQEDFAVAPENAYISEEASGKRFEMVRETEGNLLDRQKTLEALRTAVEELQERISLEEAGCYKTAGITVENERLQEAFQKLQSYADIRIVYQFGENQEILDGTVIADWVETDGFHVELDETKIEEYVSSLRKKYDTVFRKRTFRTSYGAEVTIDQGDYGWWMDTEQEIEELSDMLERGESGERTPAYRQTAAAYGMPDYGDTYVEINLTAQHLFLYVDGEMVLESDFVSGNASRGFDTPAGIYGITYKQRDATLTGENYRTPVNYWMPFNNNVGMHDATWRNAFGGDIYKTNGSHGCVNLPYSAAQEIYGHVEKGTPVICYHLPGTEPVPEVPLGETQEGVPGEMQEGVPGEVTAEVPAEVPGEMPAEVPGEMPGGMPAEVPGEIPAAQEGIPATEMSQEGL